MVQNNEIKVGFGIAVLMFFTFAFLYFGQTKKVKDLKAELRIIKGNDSLSVEAPKPSPIYFDNVVGAGSGTGYATTLDGDIYFLSGPTAQLVKIRRGQRVSKDIFDSLPGIDTYPVKALKSTSEYEEVDDRGDDREYDDPRF